MASASVLARRNTSAARVGSDWLRLPTRFFRSEAAAENRDEGIGSDGISRWQARRFWHEGIHRQHALDPTGCACLHDFFDRKQPPKIVTKVSEVMAFRDGKRVGFGTKEYIGSTRWIRLAAPAYTIFSIGSSRRKS